MRTIFAMIWGAVMTIASAFIYLRGVKKKSEIKGFKTGVSSEVRKDVKKFNSYVDKIDTKEVKDEVVSGDFII